MATLSFMGIGVKVSNFSGWSIAFFGEFENFLVVLFNFAILCAIIERFLM